MENLSKSYFSFLYYISAHPYIITWNPGFQANIRLNKNSTQFVFWYIAATISLLNSLLCWTLFIKLASNYLAKGEFLCIGFHVLWALVTLLALADLVPHLFQPSQVVQLVNGCFCLIRNLERDNLGVEYFQKTNNLRIRMFGCMCIYACVIFMLFITPLLVLFLPNYWQMGSYVYHGISILFPRCPTTILYMLGLIVDLWDCYYIWGTYLISLYINLAVQLTYKAAIQKCLNASSHGNHVQNTPAQFKRSISVVRKLKILLAVYNNVYGLLYVPIISCLLGAMSVVNTYVVIRLSDRGGPLVTGFGLCCLGASLMFTPLFIESNALVHDYSKKFYDFIHRQNSGKSPYCRRIVRSLCIDSIKCGRFYEVKKITCLTFLGLIANVCGSALISIQI